MTDFTENIVLTRQTVDLPIELMEHFDRVKRRMRVRSFGAYVVALIQRDILQVNDGQTLMPANANPFASIVDMVAMQDRKLEEIADVLGRFTAALADLGAKIEQHQRPARPTLTKTKRAKAG